MIDVQHYGGIQVVKISFFLSCNLQMKIILVYFLYLCLSNCSELKVVLCKPKQSSQWHLMCQVHIWVRSYGEHLKYNNSNCEKIEWVACVAKEMCQCFTSSLEDKAQLMRILIFHFLLIFEINSNFLGPEVVIYHLLVCAIKVSSCWIHYVTMNKYVQLTLFTIVAILQCTKTNALYVAYDSCLS